MKAIIYSLSFLLLMISCKPSEPVQGKENLNEKRWAVGKGGGFTGDYTEYILNENGKVYKYDFKYDREVYTKQLAPSDLIYFLDKIETLGLEGIDINNPGNMSYYIDVRLGKTSVNKITWGATKYYPPLELVNFHKELYDKLAEFE